MRGSAGAGAEHVSEALVRRKVLPWDPVSLAALGVGDTQTLSDLGHGAPMATPVDAFAPRASAFLLVHAPATAALATPALMSLAGTFADPAAALTVALNALRVATDVYYRAGSSSQKISSPRFDPRGVKKSLAAQTPETGTAVAHLASFGRLVRLCAAALGPAVVPDFAPSVRAARARAAESAARETALFAAAAARAQAENNPPHCETGGFGFDADAELDGIDQTACDALLTRVASSLSSSPTSVNPVSGADASWAANFSNLLHAFEAAIISAASVSNGTQGTRALLALLGSGALESLVVAAWAHAALGLRVSAARPSAGLALAGCARLLSAAFEVLAGDGVAAQRLAPFVPRLARALVALALGNGSKLADDAMTDASAATPLVSSDAAVDLSPTIIALASNYTIPIISRVFGVDGHGE